MNSKKLASIILLFTFAYSLYFFNGAIDDFAAFHTVPMNEIIQNAYVPTNCVVQVPGFDTLGAIISEISGISARNLIFLPIELIPYMLLFFLVIYKFSNSYIVASLITVVDLVSVTTGSFRVFFWPHGIGAIILYSLILILCHFFNEHHFRFYRNSELTLLFIIYGSSLIFISYDYFAYLIFLLISLFLIFLTLFLCTSYKEKKHEYLSACRRVIGLLSIFAIIEFGLSTFFYDSFVHSLKNSQHLDVSFLEKFLVAYLHRNDELPGIKGMLITYPHIISIISTIKYTFLIISIIIFITLLFNTKSKKKIFNIYDIMTLSIIFMTFFYGLIRLYIGQIAFALVFLPGVCCTIWLYRFSAKYKNWSILVMILLLILAPINSFFKSNDAFTNKDLTQYNYLNYTADWYLLNKGEAVGFSDEMTKNFVMLYASENPQSFNCKTSFCRIQKETRILPIDDAIFLVQKGNQSKFSKYYIINYKLDAMSLQNWLIIKSWKYHKKLIESNPYINKIYDINSVGIYYYSLESNYLHEAQWFG